MSLPSRSFLQETLKSQSAIDQLFETSYPLLPGNCGAEEFLDAKEKLKTCLIHEFQTQEEGFK